MDGGAGQTGSGQSGAGAKRRRGRSVRGDCGGGRGDRHLRHAGNAGGRSLRIVSSGPAGRRGRARGGNVSVRSGSGDLYAVLRAAGGVTAPGKKTTRGRSFSKNEDFLKFGADWERVVQTKPYESLRIRLGVIETVL